MKVLGMRFCKVAPKDDAIELTDMLGKLGLEQRDLGAPETEQGSGAARSDDFMGGVFPITHNQENSWIEVWPAGQHMPEMVMLQIIVDDAEAFAENARKNGLEPKGPDDAHGERIYYLEGPGGLPISFQSKFDG
ncbi:MAG: hypothetical protein AAFY84_05005 [Pseudomonadota bacterium]